MALYAVVNNGAVVNLVEWDGEAEWTPAVGEAVAIPSGEFVDIKYLYADGAFTAPPKE
ncbi:hypothetical protein LGM75_24950 [Burkholderia multivorans]|uniref:hypothetical protein n=1 Tax=Burkholderia multivorans TaxID=87883 RepID=UPI001C247E5C|nr:hypothetical protein [Burkholderia multivorans]MBU9468669.1 hypothetical protein [Burkholderia multivorans]MCA8129606.1 hypothetical protein [Burkholderia multivorans]